MYKGLSILEQLQDDKEYLRLAKFIMEKFAGVYYDGKNLFIPSLLNGVNLNFSWNERKVYIDFGKFENFDWNNLHKKSWRYFDMDHVIEVLKAMNMLEITMDKNSG